MKMCVCAVLGLLCWLGAGAVCGQVVLPEIEIGAARWQDYALGSRQYTLDSLTKSQFETRRLSDLLSAHGFYFKTYGNGMAATPALRGLGAMHTAVLWNGFPVASPTLGQVDFSQLPTFGEDLIWVQHGAGSQCFGSGAMGGSVHLESTPDAFLGETRVSIHQEISGLQADKPWQPAQGFWGASLRMGGENWQSQTRFYGSYSDNRFTYRHPRGYQAIQENAAFGYGGFQQSLFFQPKAHQRLGIHAWYHAADQRLQSTFGDRAPGDAFAQDNLRLALRYQQPGLEAGLAYFRDQTVFKNTDRTLTHRWMAQAQKRKSLRPNLDAEAGFQLIHLLAQVDSYAEGQPSESRWSAFGRLHWQPLPHLAWHLNVRQELAEGYRVPLTPDLGFAWTLSPALTVKGQVSRSFRLPTFNERYWQPGGNPEIAPELGHNLELGLVFAPKAWLSMELTAFGHRVQDWVVWLPLGGIWTPQNIQRVHATGAELRLHARHAGPWGRWQGQLHYSHTRSRFATGPHLGNQLPYTPEGQASLLLHWQHRQWHISTQPQWTARRYIANDNRAYLPSFVLVQLQAQRLAKVGQYRLWYGGRIENLLNHDYQQISNRAMPLRSYHLSLRLER
ncbi:MAG: TonB-dependent receptor plug domain-containing protein [Bernardetiaceae bacterium]